MTRDDLYPCMFGECENYVLYEQLNWCEECGSPQCPEHDYCELCKHMEEFRYACDVCGWESDAGWEEDIPDTLQYDRYFGGTLLCKDCAPDYNRKVWEQISQLNLEFENDNPELPF